MDSTFGKIFTGLEGDERTEESLDLDNALEGASNLAISMRDWGPMEHEDMERVVEWLKLEEVIATDDGLAQLESRGAPESLKMLRKRILALRVLMPILKNMPNPDQEPRVFDIQEVLRGTREDKLRRLAAVILTLATGQGSKSWMITVPELMALEGEERIKKIQELFERDRDRILEGYEGKDGK